MNNEFSLLSSYKFLLLDDSSVQKVIIKSGKIFGDSLLLFDSSLTDSFGSRMQI